MENIIFGLIGLLSRLTRSWSDLVASVGRVVDRQSIRLATHLEAAIAVFLWSVPLAFWTVVIRLVVKHW